MGNSTQLFSKEPYGYVTFFWITFFILVVKANLNPRRTWKYAKKIKALLKQITYFLRMICFYVLNYVTRNYFRHLPSSSVIGIYGLNANLCLYRNTNICEPVSHSLPSSHKTNEFPQIVIPILFQVVRIQWLFM